MSEPTVHDVFVSTDSRTGVYTFTRFKFSGFVMMKPASVLDLNLV